MFNIGFQELIIIAIIALLIVGPKKLPDLAKSLGKGFSELRRAADDITDDVKNTFKEDEKPDDDGLKNSLLLKKSDNNESNPETLDKTKKESETSSE
ncbi:MAG TPA: Sec-independent protein translocase protein TatB [Smithellaceae bacterium]|nr:twin-arginine translocase subunit TatB [Syntrophaceae bacterium]MDX9817124.1 Sec-independent protein translocase protein TatB [Smithellaceae bacterium]NMD05861.1 twin-arginine translocase subunit TatB [Deltaproteobacteria bacterium]OPZ53503.1 MAG: Sec-independent protein translocase protein TatAy [Deltaproteobacteria bacterium ADurb.BinA014]MBP8608072.1 twin-arginine translocase subunit TatB [Syntrophaceae bacterium]